MYAMVELRMGMWWRVKGKAEEMFSSEGWEDIEAEAECVGQESKRVVGCVEDAV